MKNIASKAKQIAARFEKQARPIIKKLQTIKKIKNQKDAQLAGVYLKEIKSIKSEADGELKELLSGIKEAEKKSKGEFVVFFTQVSNLDTEYKDKILKFAEDLEAKKEKLNDDFNLGKVKSIKSYNGKLDSMTLQHVKGGASIRHSTKLKIEDESLIPRQFLVPDEVAIRKALLEGIEVPGCELVKVKGISV